MSLENISLRPLTIDWRRLPQKVVGVGLIAGLVWLLVYFFTSYKFFIYGATIRGTKILTPDEVYAVSELEGLSIFYANPQQIAARLEQLPEIKRARVHCSLPNRVVIEIVEHQVDVLWEVGDQQYWVSEDNQIVPFYQGVIPQLIIKELDSQTRQVNEKLDDAVVNAARWWHEFFPEIEQFYYSPRQQISFLTEKGWVVYVSPENDVAQDVAVLKALMDELEGAEREIEYVDLRYEGRPYYR